MVKIAFNSALAQKALGKDVPVAVKVSEQNGFGCRSASVWCLACKLRAAASNYDCVDVYVPANLSI